MNDKAQSAAAPSPFPPIADYAFLSNCHTGALVAPDGSIDWLCVPRFDSPSIFGSLLDRQGGSFRLGPFGINVPSARVYEPGTNTLVTTWKTPTGWIMVTDCLTMGPRRGEDVVTPAKQLQYAWRGADNKTTAWSATNSLSLTQVGALTHDGASMLTLYASDEAGNVGSTTVDPGTLGFHGRSTAPSASGCSCDIGGSGDGGSRGGIALALMALVFLWRRRR